MYSESEWARVPILQKLEGKSPNWVAMSPNWKDSNKTDVT